MRVKNKQKKKKKQAHLGPRKLPLPRIEWAKKKKKKKKKKNLARANGRLDGRVRAAACLSGSKQNTTSPQAFFFVYSASGLPALAATYRANTAPLSVSNPPPPPGLRVFSATGGWR
jgi:hypothetical protein